jgi:hypothetical protein
MVAKKGKETLSFYSDEEYKQWEAKQKSLSSWNIEYKKGLAALENEEYREIIQNPNYFVLDKGKDFQGTLETWFAGDSNPRKLKILGIAGEDEMEEAEEPQPQTPQKKEKSKAIF